MMALIVFTVSCADIDPMLDLGFNEKVSETDNNAKTSVEIMNEERFLNLKRKQQDKNPLSDINIRKAIFFAIDRQRIVEEFYGTNNNVLNSIFNENWQYYNPSWELYEYDPEKAAGYLAKAGYDADNPLYLTMGTTENSTMRKEIQNMIIENLYDIGIETWIYNSSPNEWYTDLVSNGKYEMGLWSIEASSENDMNRYFGSDHIPLASGEDKKMRNNFYWYSNREVDELLKKLNNMNGGANKKEILQSLQNIISEDAVVLPLFNRLYTAASTNKIENLKISTDNGFFLDSIEDWTINDGEESLLIEQTVVVLPQEPYSLNPITNMTSNVMHINSLVLRGLWNKDDNGEHVPFLVEDFENMGENTSIFSSLSMKIVLRDNIFWQDGSPITSYDVRATISALKEEENLPDQFKDIHKIKSIEIINEKECVVIFDEFFDGWKSNFEILFPQFILENNKISELFYADIFGFGPYKLKEWTPNHMIFELNEYYIGQKPQIKSVKIIFNDEMSVLLPMLEEDEIDLMYIPADSRLINRVEGNSKLNLLVEKSNYWEHLALCLKPKES